MRSSILISLFLVLYAYNTLSGEKTIVSPTMPELRTLILDMANKDQAIRKKLVGSVNPSAELWNTTSDIREYNTGMAKKIYAKNGWPNVSMIGRDGVNAFWLIVQHASDFEFMRSVLPAVETAFNEGGIDAQSYALFVDRLLVNDGKPQKYGTQIKTWNNKTPVPFAIEDRTHVNAVRGSIGLFNLEDYLMLVKDAYFPGQESNSPFNGLRAEDNGGWIGLQLDVKGSGPIDNMSVKSLTVAEVAKASPAAKAGIQVGDQVIKIDGLTVEGNNTDMLMPAMDKPIGDEVTLVVRHPDGTQRKVTIVVTGSSPE